MSFIENVEQQALPIRQAILSHPFITGVGDGSLEVERFKYYVMQDYVYLIDYSRVLALATARAPDVETMRWFAGVLEETLSTEMDLHRSYCAEFGITAAALEGTRAAPTTTAYVNFLLKVAHLGSFGELVAALVPCQWGYWEIGDHLARRGVPAGASAVGGYRKWIQMYTAPEFTALATYIRRLADREGERAGAAQRVAMQEAYLTSFKYEYLFWEMAYNLETWPV
jgi:thiaminase/transcriptional activator TenA